MCGITSYLGLRSNAGTIVTAGLKKLEYRGYDSFGFAEFSPNQTLITRQLGKISEFQPNPAKKTQAHLALGHTRWATHGRVTKQNTHPQISTDKQIFVVHNGIIENQLKLKNSLIKKGYKFSSTTDTEVIPNLIAYNLKNNDFVTAVRLTAQKLLGRFAFVAVKKQTQTMIAVRKGSPLIVGIEKFFPKNFERLITKADGKSFFIASDTQAFLHYTHDIVYLDDDELVLVTPSPRTDHYHAQFHKITDGKPIPRRVISFDPILNKTPKKGFQHFMLKEIFEQKQTIYQALNQPKENFQKLANLIRKSFGTFLIGCGTVDKVCQVAEYVFANVAKRHINVIAGSEFDTAEPFLTKRTLLIAVSQSGETADILEAYAIAQKRKVRLAAIVNVLKSSVARTANLVLPINVGIEKAVASTKATTAQLAILILLAFTLANKFKAGYQILTKAAAQIDELLNPRYSIFLAKIAQTLKKVESLYVIGKAADYPIALETAIKLQEVSYIHAEGFAAGELKHGPLALITKNVPVLAFVPKDKYRSEVLTSVAEIRARGGRVLGISPVNDEHFTDWIRVPDCGLAQPLVNLIPIQLLAYHLAVLRKNNPDCPRNLAKSVTVK